MPAQYLKVSVTVTGRGLGYGIDLEFKKRVLDPASGERYFATTWNSGATGSVGVATVLEEVPNHEFIVQSLSEKVDEFLVEYLRVNEKDCPR